MARRWTYRLLAGLALLAVGAAPLMALERHPPGESLVGLNREQLPKPDSKPERAPLTVASRFAAHNTLFIMYHELGHLVINEFNLPVLGREEDAADNFATWTMLSKGTRRMEDALADAAHGWILTERLSEDGEYHRSAFYDEHSLNLQRAYQIVCLMVGVNRAKFRAYATEMGIDSDRQQRCYWDYEQLAESMEKVLEPHVSKTGGQAEVEIIYEDARRNLAIAAQALRDSGVIEEVADEIRASYVLPRPATIRVTTCGESNAFYSPRENEIIYCYELMHEFLRQYAAEIAPQN